MRTSGARGCVSHGRSGARGCCQPAPPDTGRHPPPDLGTHLPGAWRELVLTPAPHTPIPHLRTPSVSTVWSVAPSVATTTDPRRLRYWHRRRCRAGGAYTSGRRRRSPDVPRADVGAAPGGAPVGIVFGQGVVVPRAPSGIVPGRYRVTLTTLSPVVIRRSADGKTLVRVMPTASSLRASLTGREFLRRIGLTEVPAWTRDACLRDGRSRHPTRQRDTDGHWNAGDGGGTKRGRLARVARPGGQRQTLALLRCAEVVGLGGRVAVDSDACASRRWSVRTRRAPMRPTMPPR